MIIFKCNSLEREIAKANNMTPYVFALEKRANTRKYERMMENAIDAAVHNDGLINEHTVRHWCTENDTERERREARERVDQAKWERREQIRAEKEEEIRNRLTENDIIDQYQARLDEAKKTYDNTVKKIEEEKKKMFICPECGSELTDREGPYGAFVGCTNYPNCNYSRRFWNK